VVKEGGQKGEEEERGREGEMESALPPHPPSAWPRSLCAAAPAAPAGGEPRAEVQEDGAGWMEWEGESGFRIRRNVTGVRRHQWREAQRSQICVKIWTTLWKSWR
jgi:hypothetical protein